MSLRQIEIVDGIRVIRVWTVLAAALFYRARPEQDLWFILTGMFYVFFADLWGTTNNCWHYYLVYEQSTPLKVMAGVSFGMLFDATVILTALKISRFFIPGGKNRSNL